MPSTWTDATDRQLLMIIIHVLSPSPPKWSVVADMMGEDFTVESVRQHYMKMRKDFKAKFGDIVNEPAGAAVSASKSTPTTGTPRKRKSKNRTETELGDTDASPSKKAKTKDVEEDRV